MYGIPGSCQSGGSGSSSLRNHQTGFNFFQIGRCTRPLTEIVCPSELFVHLSWNSGLAGTRLARTTSNSVKPMMNLDIGSLLAFTVTPNRHNGRTLAFFCRGWRFFDNRPRYVGLCLTSRNPQSERLKQHDDWQCAHPASGNAAIIARRGGGKEEGWVLEAA